LLKNKYTLVTQDRYLADEFIRTHFDDCKVIGVDTEFTFMNLDVIQVATEKSTLAFHLDRSNWSIKIPCELNKLLCDCDILKFGIDPNQDIKLLQPFCDNQVVISDICTLFRNRFNTIISLGAVKLMKILGYNHSKGQRMQNWKIFDPYNSKKWEYALLDPILPLLAYNYIN
jgi:ribonuclease D